MRFWIAIENSTGTKYGDGPIISATSWRHTARLDRAGTFEFEMPATDEKAALVQPKRVARCYGQLYPGAVISELGAGIIDKIAIEPHKDGSVTLRVSGDDLLRELTYRAVGFLEIKEDSVITPSGIYYYNGSTYVDLPNLYDDDPVTTQVVPLITTDWLYIGYTSQFDLMRFNVSVSNSTSTYLIANYPNGVVWADLPITDGTANAGRPLAVDGDITFTLPPDWQRFTLEGLTAYWVRIRPYANLSSTTALAEIDVFVRDQPTRIGPQLIMAKAPTGWSLDTVAGYNVTAGGRYGAFGGESVLAACEKLAEHGGEHFRLGTGRKLVWLQDNLTDSGIRCIQGADPIAIEDNHNVALIDTLEEVDDTYELMTRIYPYGAGEGEIRLSMRGVVATLPTGYVFGSETIAGTTYYYIRHADTETTYGRIEKFLTFSEIRPLDNTESGVIEAANELRDTAVEYLRRRIAPQKAYRLSLVKLDQMIYPGQKIQVEYRRYVPTGKSTYKALDIDANLYVLEATTQIDNNGLRTVALEVSTVDAWPTTEAEIIAGLMEDGQVFKAHPQLNANSYVVSYREIMDNSHPANIRFWLGREVVNINQCVFRFRIDPLWSSVKSIGGTSTTTGSGGGESVTSGSSSASTSASGSNHHHTASIANSASGTNITAINVSGSEYQLAMNGLSGHIATIDENSHTHGMSHTHGVTTSNHTHDVTASVSASYGVYLESGANTLAETDLVYILNGGSDLGAAVTAIGSGWYELDLTSAVRNASYQPVIYTNNLAISTAVAKTATITGQLIVRNVIQSMALV